MTAMVVLDKIYAYGHDNVLCTHTSTIEITKDSSLTTAGNCILGINSSKACFELNPNLRNMIKQGKKITVTIMVDGKFDSFYGYGNSRLTLLSKEDLVFRKSEFICDRTVLINCTKSSIELDRELINRLKELGKKFKILFEVNDSNE